MFPIGKSQYSYIAVDTVKGIENVAAFGWYVR